MRVIEDGAEVPRLYGTFRARVGQPLPPFNVENMVARAGQRGPIMGVFMGVPEMAAVRFEEEGTVYCIGFPPQALRLVLGTRPRRRKKTGGETAAADAAKPAVTAATSGSASKEPKKEGLEAPGEGEFKVGRVVELIEDKATILRLTEGEEMAWGKPSPPRVVEDLVSRAGTRAEVFSTPKEGDSTVAVLRLVRASEGGAECLGRLGGAVAGGDGEGEEKEEGEIVPELAAAGEGPFEEGTEVKVIEDIARLRQILSDPALRVKGIDILLS